MIATQGGRLHRCRLQAGWGTSEYLAVLLGLIMAWQGAQAVLTLLREHHDEFSWALMIPL